MMVSKVGQEKRTELTDGLENPLLDVRPFAESLIKDKV